MYEKINKPHDVIIILTTFNLRKAQHVAVACQIVVGEVIGSNLGSTPRLNLYMVPTAAMSGA